MDIMRITPEQGKHSDFSDIAGSTPGEGPGVPGEDIGVGVAISEGPHAPNFPCSCTVPLLTAIPFHAILAKT